MDDLTPFDRQVAAEFLRDAGPSLPVDDAAIYTAITALQPPKWRFQSMFSATKFVIVGAILALFGGFLLTSALHRGADVGHDLGAAASASAAVVSPTPTDGSSEERLTLVIDGIALSIGQSSDQADPSPLPLDEEGAPKLRDGLYMAWDTSGSQAAEAMILWTTFPGSGPARPCLLDPSAGSSLVALADAVATAPGTELVSGPADMTVGGRAAKHVVVTVSLDASLAEATGGARMRTLGCDPGFFFGWEEASLFGSFWLETVPSDTIGVWIVDADGTLLFIEAVTHPEANEAVKQEIDDIIDSIRFE